MPIVPLLRSIALRDPSELDAASAELAAILRSAADGITVQDRAGDLVFANDAAARLMGYDSPRELLETPSERLMSRFELFGESGEAFSAHDLPGRRALRGETPAEQLVRWRTVATGEERWSLVRATPVFAADGEVRLAVNVFQDATDRVEQQKAAERANRAKDEFLAVMSHELRTPLNAILGYAELLETGISTPLDAAQAKYVERIRASGEFLLELIDQMLSFARVGAGTEGLRVARLDLPRVCRDAAMLVESQAAAKGLALRLALPDALPQIATDSRKLRQILLNLLGNAVKFTDDGRVELSVRATEDDVLFEVRDTGPGIAPEDLEAIFEPFRQLDGSITRRVGGTGLGLAVSRELATLLGGELTVRSEVGVGSSFTLRLPVRVSVPAGS